MFIFSSLIIALSYLVPTAFSQDTCPVVRYTGSFQERDHVKDHALLGRSYKNLTTNTVQECFSVCINECRCVSYQLSGTRCELIDDDRHTAPDRFKPMSGYKFYELKQKFYTKEANVAGCTSQCYNGFCRFKPCQNGGTCIELCQDAKRKFKCHCSNETFGRVCEKVQMSCAKYAEIGLDSGFYPIHTANQEQKQVYCDTKSEPGLAWTLIESFALVLKDKYEEKSLTKDFPSNEGKLNWTDHRLSRSFMQHIQRHATHWRATCNYDKGGLNKTDYIRFRTSELDILSYANGHTCIQAEYINVRGISCENCTSHVRQDTNIHVFVDSNAGIYVNCQWSGKVGSVYFAGDWCDNFGRYLLINPAHRCSSSPSSTTQWWLGTVF